MHKSRAKVAVGAGHVEPACSSTRIGTKQGPRAAGRPSGRHAHKCAAWSDQEMLARMLDREPLAWREFLRRYRRLIAARIHAVIRGFATVVGSADAEDIEAMLMCSLQRRDMHPLRAFQAQRGIRLATWIGLLARNAAWDYLRAHARWMSIGSAVGAGEGGFERDDPERSLAARRRWEVVRAEMSSLSRQDQCLLRLCLEGERPAAISREMNISVRAVYSKKSRMQGRLRVALTEHC